MSEKKNQCDQLSSSGQTDILKNTDEEGENKQNRNKEEDLTFVEEGEIKKKASEEEKQKGEDDTLAIFVADDVKEEEEEEEEEDDDDDEAEEEEEEDDDDEDDEDEEEEEEQEEEELEDEEEANERNDHKGRMRKREVAGDKSNRGSKKKKRRKDKIISKFLDTEAQVGDEDEEEDYESVYVDEADELKKVESQKIYEQGLKSGTNHLAQTINKLSKRYGEQLEGGLEEKDEVLAIGDEEEDIDLLGETDLSDQELLTEVDGEVGELLGVYDNPKLWLVKLFKNNAERSLAISIYYKCMKYKDLNYNLKGVYVSDNLKGYIYVEADSLYMLKNFLLDFKIVNLNEVSIVPVQELTSIFSMCQPTVVIPKVNEFVRIKRGLYANDVGQIFEVDEKGTYAIVRLIPRIIYDEEVSIKRKEKLIKAQAADIMQEQQGIYKSDIIYTSQRSDLNKHLSKSLKEDRKLASVQIIKKKDSERPIKKLFDRDEVERTGGTIESGPYPRTIKYKNQIFEEDGYILKKMSMKFLRIKDANIKAEEVKKFNSHRKKEDNVYRYLPKSDITKSQLNLYKIGEKVKIRKGDLRNLTGVITEIGENFISIKPDNMNRSFSFLPSEIMKCFNEGDNVTVIAGAHKGKSGLISLIDYKENMVLLFSPTLGTEIRTLIQNISISADDSEPFLGINSLQGFSIGDLVELNDRSLGILTYIDKNRNVRILVEEGKVINTTIEKIMSKRSTIGQVCLDGENNILNLKDSIHVLKGEHKGKLGVVVYIWKDTVFAKLHKKTEDNGYVVLDAKKCALHGCFLEKKKTVGSGNMFRQKNENPRYLRNNYVGKTVKILTGFYKGLLADVITAEKEDFTLLLKIKPKTVRHKRADCVLIDASKERDMYYGKLDNSVVGGIVERGMHSLGSGIDPFKGLDPTRSTLENAEPFGGKNASGFDAQKSLRGTDVDGNNIYGRNGNSFGGNTSTNFDSINNGSSNNLGKGRMYGYKSFHSRRNNTKGTGYNSKNWKTLDLDGSVDLLELTGGRKKDDFKYDDYNNDYIKKSTFDNDRERERDRDRERDRELEKGNNKHDNHATHHKSRRDHERSVSQASHSHSHPPPPATALGSSQNHSRKNHYNHSSNSIHSSGRDDNRSYNCVSNSRSNSRDRNRRRQAKSPVDKSHHDRNRHGGTSRGYSSTDEHINMGTHRHRSRREKVEDRSHWKEHRSGENENADGAGKRGDEKNRTMQMKSNSTTKPEWLVCGIIVQVVMPGAYLNEVGRIDEIISKEGIYILNVHTEKTHFRIVHSATLPVKPKNINDSVIIIDGNNKIEGVLKDMHHDEFIIKTIGGIVKAHPKQVYLYKHQ